MYRYTYMEKKLFIFFTKHRRLLPYIVHSLPIFTFIEKTQTAPDMPLYALPSISSGQKKNNVFTSMQVPPC